MESYLEKYDTLDRTIVFKFSTGDGGIGDILKGFTYLLQLCIENNIRLCYVLSNNIIDKYLKLRHSKMYITMDKIFDPEYNTDDIISLRTIGEVPDIESGAIYIAYPQLVHPIKNLYDKISYSLEDIFDFTGEVITRARDFIGGSYRGIHLRMGDKYLETDKAFIICSSDARLYNEDAIFRCIESYNSNTVFFCDNKEYKLKIKAKYPSIHITDYDIGHTSLSNTTEQQILDAVTEFYLLAHSEYIYTASDSGFSMMASKFKGVPIIALD
jgi:hypothetical protein